MSENTNSNAPVVVERRRSGQTFWHTAIVVALLANVALFINSRQIAGALAQMDQHTQDQFGKLNQDLSQSSQTVQQHAESLARESQEAGAQAAAAAEAHAKQELRRNSATLTAELQKQQEMQAQAQQQVTGQLNDLQQANTSASAKIGEISGDVTGVKTDVATTKTQLDQTSADLKKAVGDMGVMSGLIATNGQQLDALKQLGDRDYIQFDLKKGSARQKVGDMQLTLAKADPKRNRFTLQVLADDKTVEKRDRGINEPVQLYVSGNRQPEEIIVNEVKKDEVVGYVAVPKVKIARR